MSLITAANIITSASEIVSDPDNDQWTTTDGLGWVNDGQRAISLLRPDASSRIVNLTLVAGTRQTIVGRRLLRVIRNMGADGATPGLSPRVVDMAMKDEFEQNWHTVTAASPTEEIMHDGIIPDTFYVSPPVPASPQIVLEIVESVSPTDIASLSSVINIDDIYSPVLIEWVLYRFFSRDHETTANGQRSIKHYNNFFQLLGLKSQSDLSTDVGYGK